MWGSQPVEYLTPAAFVGEVVGNDLEAIASKIEELVGVSARIKKLVENSRGFCFIADFLVISHHLCPISVF